MTPDFSDSSLLHTCIDLLISLHDAVSRFSLAGQIEDVGWDPVLCNLVKLFFLFTIQEISAKC